MPAYEATLEADYAKIVDFLNSQPPDSIWNKCFQGVITERTVEWIKFFKEQRLDWHIFYVEDQRGKVRALGTLEKRELSSNEPKMVTNVILLMDEEDVAKNYEFAFELLIYMAKWCIERECYVAEFVLRDVDVPFLHKESTTVLRKLGERFGHEIYLCQVDVKKFVGR